MKIAGIIAEYNPFHSGHAYHIAKVKEQCDAVVVCMAGSYTQRGEASCLSKWDRARMALSCGADAVFELPALFAVRSAEAFAGGGIAILDGRGVDVLSFGCEDTSLPEGIAHLKMHEPEDMKRRVRANLAAGQSYPRAWGEAASVQLGVSPEALNAPNVILGAEYVRACLERGSKMEILPIPRRGSYHGNAPANVGEYASASAVRTALREGRMEDALKWTPEKVRDILSSAPGMHAPDDLLLARLRSMTPEEIADLPDVGEGLEKRIHRMAMQAGSGQDLIDRLKCRRYTRARLMRICAYALLGMTKEFLKDHPEPEYARLIGMREDARAVLRELKDRARLPVCSDPVRMRENAIFQLECRATDLRALQCDAPKDRAAGQELTHSFVRV